MTRQVHDTFFGDALGFKYWYNCSCVFMDVVGKYVLFIRSLFALSSGHLEVVVFKADIQDGIHFVFSTLNNDPVSDCPLALCDSEKITVW